MLALALALSIHRRVFFAADERFVVNRRAGD
jgi:hypothetical protein